eukprot:1941308-Rhodomonas_salina.2
MPCRTGRPRKEPSATRYPGVLRRTEVLTFLPSMPQTMRHLCIPGYRTQVPVVKAPMIMHR